MGLKTLSNLPQRYLHNEGQDEFHDITSAQDRKTKKHDGGFIWIYDRSSIDYLDWLDQKQGPKFHINQRRKKEWG